jgi:hypothetical protein
MTTEERLPRMLVLQEANDRMEKLGLPKRPEITLINWIQRYHLGHKVGGQWVFREDRFEKFLLGEYEKEASRGEN